MNHKYSALALAALAMGTVALSTTEASAMLKDPGSGPAATPASAYDWPDESGSEGVQLGASALGGAGVAFGGMWLYRRRHLLVG